METQLTYAIVDEEGTVELIIMVSICCELI